MKKAKASSGKAKNKASKSSQNAKKAFKKPAKRDFWGQIIEVTLNQQNAPLDVFGFYPSATATGCPSTCTAGHNTGTMHMACC